MLCGRTRVGGELSERVVHDLAGDVVLLLCGDGLWHRERRSGRRPTRGLKPGSLDLRRLHGLCVCVCSARRVLVFDLIPRALVEM